VEAQEIVSLYFLDGTVKVSIVLENDKNYWLKLIAIQALKLGQFML